MRAFQVCKITCISYTWRGIHWSIYNGPLLSDYRHVILLSTLRISVNIVFPQVMNRWASFLKTLFCLKLGEIINLIFWKYLLSFLGLPYRKTEDGLESMYATNYFGPFLLSNLLLGNETSFFNRTVSWKRIDLSRHHGVCLLCVRALVWLVVATYKSFPISRIPLAFKTKTSLRAFWATLNTPPHLVFCRFNLILIRTLSWHLPTPN